MGAKRKVRSTNCGGEEKHYRNPFPTVDIIIELDDRGVILISVRIIPSDGHSQAALSTMENHLKMPQ